MDNLPVVLINHLLEPPEKITGITRFLFSLLSELVSNSSFRYVLLTTWRRDSLPQSLRAASLEVVTDRYVQSTPLNIINQMRILPNLMRTARADVEFNCNPIGCFWASWPRVITVHDLYFELLPKEFPRRHQLWWRLAFPRAINAAAAIICVSKVSRQHLVSIYPQATSKAVVIHEAGMRKPAEVFNDEEIVPTQQPYALYVGNISPNKNPVTLVKGLKVLERRGIVVPTYHVGRDELGLLSKAQQETALRHPIQKLGTVSDAALAALYRGAYCLVNTSTDEGFCLPVLEAQSFGVPVVCSDIPVLREVAGEAALFFDPSNSASLADEISRLFGSPSLHADMAVRALANAALFSWGRAAAEMEVVFHKIMNRTR